MDKYRSDDGQHYQAPDQQDNGQRQIRRSPTIGREDTPPTKANGDISTEVIPEGVPNDATRRAR